jgi:hypothetical protein
MMMILRSEVLSIRCAPTNKRQYFLPDMVAPRNHYRMMLTISTTMVAHESRDVLAPISVTGCLLFRSRHNWNSQSHSS